MKVLVTGGAGYIGSVCVERLVDCDHDVVVLDNLLEGHLSAVHPEAVFIKGDIGDPRGVREALREHRPDGIIHFAAHSLVGESMQAPGKYFRNNVAHALNLIEACVEEGVKKFVFSSTAATYGVPAFVPIDESCPTVPINPYGRSKLMVEQMLEWFGSVHGLESVVFRYFNAAGASKTRGEHHRVETHLIPILLKVALGQKAQCEIFGDDHATPDGTCVRDYIHVLDLADAHVRALNRGISGTFNLGNNAGHSVKEVLECCRRVTGHPIPAIMKPRRAGDPPSLVACSDRVRSELGWKPSHASLEAIVSSAWAWHMANPDGYPD